MSQLTAKHITTQVKKYLKDKEYPQDIIVKSQKDLIIIDNLHHSTAAQLCEWATGLRFEAIGFSICKLKNTN